MSQSEECSISSPEGDEAESPTEQLQKPIYAFTPDIDLNEEHLGCVSASPVLECLEELFSEGKISGDKVAKLKAKLHLLNCTLRSSQETELNLLEEAKQFRTKLELQKQELEKTEDFPEDTDVSRMRQQLLQFHNTLREAKEKEYEMQYKLKCLQEEKICLKKEYEIQLKSVVEETQFTALNESCEEMRKEIGQRQQEIKALNEGVEAQHNQIQNEQKELNYKKEMIESKEAELAQLLPVPVQLSKEMERINRKKMDLKKHLAELQVQLQELVGLIKNTHVRSRQLDEERKAVIQELEGCKAQLEAAQRESSMLFKEMEMTKEKKAILHEQRGLLDINLSHILVERKALHDSLVQKVREKDRLLRSLKKMQLQHKLSKDALLHTQELYNKTMVQRNIMPTNDDLIQKINILQEEVDNLKLKLVDQQALTGTEAHVVEQCIQQEQALIRECSICHEELHHLHSLTRIKADERDQKSRELLKAQLRCSRIKQDVWGKQLQIQEHKKRYQEIQSRLCVFAKLYDIIKGERNKCVNLIQLATQRSAEMREKLKILENEIEILRTNAVNKDRLLQKSRLKHAHSHTIKDSLKNDISKVDWMLQEMCHKRGEQRLNITKLTHIINAKEQDLLHMCNSYEASVQSRNTWGVQLLAREQELCISYEKVNMQESLICQGTLEIQALEEEIHSFKLLINEEKRQINLCKKQVPSKKALEDEFALLQIQLSECKDHLMSLEKAFKDRASEKISHKQSDEDPTPEELIIKIEQVLLNFVCVVGGAASRERGSAVGERANL
ncbi:coiled-coil domain-containing protein 146 isoform X2 [Trichomycterus rosablanca]|uniref:coiled-coil domain-containing protein 146 isoform X2 n=1 Tax=Trichomycterus rosablanca TaxID=2290929 RepID=UPI002F34FCF6